MPRGIRSRPNPHGKAVDTQKNPQICSDILCLLLIRTVPKREAFRGAFDKTVVSLHACQRPFWWYQLPAASPTPRDNGMTAGVRPAAPHWRFGPSVIARRPEPARRWY
jgi:hypothetical protein